MVTYGTYMTQSDGSCERTKDVLTHIVVLVTKSSYSFLFTKIRRQLS